MLAKGFFQLIAVRGREPTKGGERTDPLQLDKRHRLSKDSWPGHTHWDSRQSSVSEEAEGCGRPLGPHLQERIE